METYKHFPCGVGSSVSNTTIHHSRKTFQVMGTHKVEGEVKWMKDIARRDAESVESSRVEA